MLVANEGWTLPLSDSVPMVSYKGQGSDQCTNCPGGSLVCGPGPSRICGSELFLMAESSKRIQLTSNVITEFKTITDFKKLMVPVYTFCYR